MGQIVAIWEEPNDRMGEAVPPQPPVGFSDGKGDDFGVNGQPADNPFLGGSLAIADSKLTSFDCIQ